MYKIVKTSDLVMSCPFPVSFDYDSCPVYHPFSYYVLGGIDVDGDSLLLNADIDFDPEDEIEAGCSVDGATDPRISGFDIAESVGIQAYEKVREKATKSAPASSDDGDKSKN